MTNERYMKMIATAFFEFGLLVLFLTVPQIILGVYVEGSIGNFYAMGFLIGMFFQQYKERKHKKKLRALLATLESIEIIEIEKQSHDR